MGWAAVILPRSEGRDDPEPAADPPDDEVVVLDLDRSRPPGRRRPCRARRAPFSSADHDPRSDQPTSIEAITTWPFWAAPSITA